MDAAFLRPGLDAVTLCGVLLAVTLFSAEFSSFVTLQRTTTVRSSVAGAVPLLCSTHGLPRALTLGCGPQLGVDTARDRLLRIHLDISFPALPCQGGLALSVPSLTQRSWQGGLLSPRPGAGCRLRGGCSLACRLEVAAALSPA